MPHEHMIKSNLEPIEESDMDLEGKLKKGNVETSPESKSSLAAVEREVPQEISAAEKDDAYGKILLKVQTQSDDDKFPHDVVANDAKIGAQILDAESQVQHLVDIAGQKGVVHAVKVARH